MTSLEPGYNVVTERVRETPEILPALTFFRYAALDKSITTPVTVTGLEDLLYYAVPDDREAIVTRLRRVLRQTNAYPSTTSIQFLVDGRLVSDNRFRIRVERGGGDAVYLGIGELFVEEPRVVSPNHAVARK
jgi:hypothetical protein